MQLPHRVDHFIVGLADADHQTALRRNVGPQLTRS
jgi:hypothetical protein